MAWPPPGASTTESFVAEVTVRDEIAIASGLSRQCDVGASA